MMHNHLQPVICIDDRISCQRFFSSITVIIFIHLDGLMKGAH